ncbi:Fanconi anemia group A protein homolog isoform X2 [Antennarius striatus]|uniref:Fanconi anemia group A protein homolog isoform X2 n=1 Tax=Antennarius striatus TaxID=241820 RepID=UPI0035B4071A
MSLSGSRETVSTKRTLSNILAGRVVKRPKQEDGRRLQGASIQLLEQQQNICSLLTEVGDGEQKQTQSKGLAGSLLVSELRRQAFQLGVPVTVLAVKMVLERLMEITGTEEVKEEERRGLFSPSQRVQLCVLLESVKDLLSEGVFCPKLLWQEYKRDQYLQKQPQLEVMYYLHFYNILTFRYILESDEGVRSWLVSQLMDLCSWRPPEGEDETRQVQQRVLLTVAGLLVGAGFELSSEPAAGDQRISLLCCSVLDDMLFWLLDIVENSLALQRDGATAKLWIQIFDASLCGASASDEALRCFFKHSLTQTLTYKPRLAVSDAVALQNEWTFAKVCTLVTSLFRKLAVVLGVEQLLSHLQQVLETHEVNWKHVLCFLSTLLVHNPCAEPSLRKLLSRLLSSAFESYELENLITAFLLARQGALEGPGVFPSYSEWFKMSFGGSTGYHATSKKSLVFLLKFLSELVPFEPPQYLKVHILHPPYVPAKHRSLLMEYVSLAKTRLADLKESVEDMGLYEAVSGAGGAAAQCQAVQDVEKAASLFESTGKIPATVMEASIFRRPYFLTRFLPALLTPRVLPVKADAQMSFIEALKKADKIPSAQYASYMEACQKQRQQDSTTCLDSGDEPLDVLRSQLEEFTALLVEENDGEISARLSRISHTLSDIFPDGPDGMIRQSVIRLHINTPPPSGPHLKVINLMLTNFCQCMLNVSRCKPPNKQTRWASRFVSVLLGNTQLLTSLLHRLWDLFHNQGPSLSAAHLLGLATFLVHLHASMSDGPLVQLVSPILATPVSVGEALCSALVCSTQDDMIFCVRLCVLAVCYGLCRGHSLPQQQQEDYIITSLCKKLQYLIPRLLPEARGAPIPTGGPVDDHQENRTSLWSSATDHRNTWRKTAWHLWRHPSFHQLGLMSQYQLSLSEWLTNELRVQRRDDVLSDPERQEYQQWACLELFLPRPEEQGGCGGDTKSLCSHLLTAIMDQQLSNQVLETFDKRLSGPGTCLPDILSRLQELVYEMELTHLSSSRPGGADVHDFLFALVSERCSSAGGPGSAGLSGELSLQNTVNTWNRVLLTLPPTLLIEVKTEGGRTTLDCNRMIEHINQQQRKACPPDGVLSHRLTTHILKGVLCVSVRCERWAEEVNKAWSQISLRCPLLLVSTVHWWERLSPVLLSLWGRLGGGGRLPEQLQLLADCHDWSCSLETRPSLQPPAAAALVLAASLHRVCGAQGSDRRAFSAALNVMRPESRKQDREVLLFLFFLCVKDFLSELLYPQETHRGAGSLCSDLLSVLVDAADWLLIFKSNEPGVLPSFTMMTSEEFTRLMPWAFYSLLFQQSPELQHKAACCPGFLHTAVLCFVSLQQLFLGGHTPTGDPSDPQMQPLQIVSQARRLLLAAISEAPPAALSTNQLTLLQARCADVDPDVAAALSVLSDPHSLSPEMDFL